MIIDKDIDIKITGYNIRFYREKHPHIETGDIIKVNQITGLSPRSTEIVECICSNEGCGERFTRKRRNIHSENTYCSDKCRGEDIKSNNLVKFKNEILHKIKARISNEESIKYNDIKKDDPQLLHAIDKYYPMNEIFSDLGISEEELINKYGITRNINKRTLTEKEILDRLNYLKSIGRLTTSAMRTEFDDFRLEISIKKIYGSVENCFEELGFERDIYSNDKLIMMGREFEEVFKNILKEMNIQFDYQRALPNGTIPDFQIHGESTIIDTKLSSWTTSIPEDIEKYSNFCNKIIFVYLREGSSVPEYGDNVELVNVKKYIDNLPFSRKNYYINLLNNILSYHP